MNNDNLNGVLNINKTQGMTSHDVVAKVRHILGIKKVGHLGTLDPAAEGVLPICVGKATKLSQFLISANKSYRAIMKLGVSTDTQDATGKIIKETKDFVVSEASFKKTLVSFIGEIKQIPPMFSAKKHKGKRLYELAREGKTVERKASNIKIFSLELINFTYPFAEFVVECSKGTYIRTLCADIGETIGCGAHLVSLVRLKSGAFELDDSVNLTELKNLVEQGKVSDKIYSVENSLRHLPSLILKRDSCFNNSVSLKKGRWVDETHVVHEMVRGAENLASSFAFNNKEQRTKEREEGFFKFFKLYSYEGRLIAIANEIDYKENIITYKIQDIF
ncbi:MAG: tRNA pseudouridine(55) synthase TruB [bacterium]